MKENKRIARQEYKKLLDKYGEDGILNCHITEVVNRTGLCFLDMQDAMNYYRYRVLRGKVTK